MLPHEWLSAGLSSEFASVFQDSDIVEVLVASKSEDVVEDESMTRARGRNDPSEGVLWGCTILRALPNTQGSSIRILICE